MHQNRVNTQSLVLALDLLNEQLSEILSVVANSSFDNQNTEVLVSKLLSFVSRRQLLLEALIADKQFVDRDYLQLQLSLTQTYKENASVIRQSSQILLQAGSNSQRNINVYKKIDANR
jgi:hypothetical protein